MLNNQGFDLWANGYDKSVNISDENDEYPFAGYKNILNTIFNMVMEYQSAKVLDIGIGTGVLSSKLYENNHHITGIDFSDKMLEISKSKMPNAKFIKHDFTKGLPDKIQNTVFDFIIFTYSIHHLKDNEKIILLNSLKNNLNNNGKIIIGDVSFENQTAFASCQKQFESLWDYDEFYYSFDKIKNNLHYKNIRYSQMSICGGIMILENGD